MNNKETVRILIEDVFNKGRLSVLREIIHPNYSYKSPNESMVGIEDLSAFVVAFRTAFPDLLIQVDDQIAEREQVCTRITVTGTHCGDFLGAAATGNKVNLQGVVVSRLENGLIVEEWELLDQLTLLQQLGLAESPEHN